MKRREPLAYRGITASLDLGGFGRRAGDAVLNFGEQLQNFMVVRHQYLAPRIIPTVMRGSANSLIAWTNASARSGLLSPW